MPLSLPELAGGIGGGLLAKVTSGPGKQAEESMNSILEILRRNPEQIDIWNARAGQGWDEWKKGLDRGRFYLDEAGATVREAPAYIKSAAGTFDRAEAAYQPGLDYVTNVLYGGPAAMEAISPEVNALRTQYGQATQAASQFAPRGGGRASVLSELPYRQTSDITSLLSQARRGAAELLPTYGQGLTQIGQARGELATAQANIAEVQRRIGATEGEFASVAGQMGLSAGQLGIMLQDVMTRGAAAILDYDIKNRDLIFDIVSAAANAGAKAGSSLWDLFKKIAGLFSGGGAPSGTIGGADGGGGSVGTGEDWLNPDPLWHVDWTNEILYGGNSGWTVNPETGTWQSPYPSPGVESVETSWGPAGGEWSVISGSSANNQLPPNWSTMSLQEKLDWLNYFYGISP